MTMIPKNEGMTKALIGEYDSQEWEIEEIKSLFDNSRDITIEIMPDGIYNVYEWTK